MSEASRIHEGLLESNETRIYVGQVTEVMRYETGEVKDFIGNSLNPKEILFNVGEIIKGAKARPLELSNEVKKGDLVLIFSMELLYNNSFFYHPIRFNDTENNTLYMKYGNSELRFIPKDGSNTDVKLAGGKSVISLNPEMGTIRLDSDSGGIGINAHRGMVEISNNETSLKKILELLVDKVTDLKVLTPHGTPASLTPDSISGLMDVSLEISKLLGNVTDTSLYPHIPEDTYTVEFAAEAVNEMGRNFLNDHGDPDPPKVITNLQEMFPEDEEVTPTDPNELPIISTVVPKRITPSQPEDEAKYDPNKDIQLSENYWLSQVTTKALFPHKLKAQRGLSKDDLVKNLQHVAVNLLEPIRAKYPNLRINSGFRGNPSLSGGRVSQHEVGEAIDLQFPGITYRQYMQVAEWVIQNTSFDQLIFEHGKSIWLHISSKRTGSNRATTLTMKNGRYESGIKLYYN